MSSRRRSSRRDFLKGRAAVQSLQDLVDGDSTTVPPTSSTASEGGAASYLFQIERRAMAVDFQVYLNAGQHPGAPEVALEALDLVEALEAQMSVYRSDSEISDINRRAAEQAVSVEPELFALLKQAVDLCESTGGAFDITSGPLSKAWGFFRRQGRFPEQKDVEGALQLVGTKWLELDVEAKSIHFHKSGVEINVNAIGKGHALDRCAGLLRGAGVEDFLIHGGQSSILAGGSRTGAPSDKLGWTVALRHPLRPDRRLAEIRLHDRALGTSGSGTQFFHHKGRRFGHVLDPRTGWPAEGVFSATVIAPTAAQADALSTAFYAMGLDETVEYCHTHEELSAIMVCPGERAGSIVIHAIGLDDDDWRRVDE
jgi:thiamine biosynthesis lipoprotein